jgi:aminoglycoside phosphotransferase (APT) family kinase protein
LDQTNVVSYLIDAGLIDRHSAARGRVRVADMSRRNTVLAVTTERPPDYVVKQPRQRHDPGVAREAIVLRTLRAETGVRRFLPVLVGYDEHDRVLVLESSAGRRDLRAHHARGRFSAALAHAAGRALASVHRLPADAVGARPDGFDPTWPMSWHRPRLVELFDLSAAGIALLRMAQGSRALCEELDEMHESWCANAVIHGDPRWENWIALPAAPGRGRRRLLLLDWELAGPGDPCLDVGTFMAEYLQAWVSSIPIVDSRDPGLFSNFASQPLDRMQPAIRQFWRSYVAASGEHAKDRPLVRAVRFAGVRLLQAAVERADRASDLRAHTVALMQLGFNVLQRPADAAGRLLGLPVPAGAL